MTLKMKFGYVFYFILCHIIVALADDEKVLQYSSETFEASVKTNNHFVMFYAPWCGHCKRLHPIWEQLAEMVNAEDDSQITIAQVDCTVDHQLCTDNDVTGYPTLKFFKLGSLEGVKFRGTRDLPSLTSFINEQLGTFRGETLPTETQSPSGLIDLTETNFDSSTSSGSYFVKFYAPWCGHCQKLAPTWEELAKRFESNNRVSIARVDCTTERSVCNTHEIKGYPTLLFIKDGSVAERYTGQRTLEEMDKFVRRLTNGEANEGSNVAEDVTEEAGLLLGADTFEGGIANGLTLVKFFAPWCGHCKRLAPTWTELNHKLKDSSVARVARVDCTQSGSKDLCNQQEVEGFPTLLLYRNGEKISEYNGPRNVEDMYQFLAKHFQHDEL